MTKTKTKTNTFREHLRRAILETSDQSDEETWPDQQKDNDKHKYNEKEKGDGN